MEAAFFGINTMTRPLKTNVESFKIKRLPDTTFWVRGLTYDEMISFQSMFEDREDVRASDFYNVGKTCLIGWDGLEVWIDGELYDIRCNEANIEEYLTPSEMSEIGKFAFTELSFLSQIDELKFKGYINWIFYISDEKQGKNRRESFDCENCARKGIIFDRPCGRKDKQQLIEKYHGKPETTVKRKSAVEIAKAKFGIKNKVYRTGIELTKEEQEIKAKEREQKAKSIMINKLMLPECPVSWIKPPMRMLADALWDASKNNKTYMKGGIGDQPNKIYQAERLISSESNRLESEEIKKQTK